MRHLPRFTYSGLTMVLSNPSRFDDKTGKLLSGFAGDYVDEHLRPTTNRYCCDIRTADTLDAGLLDGTKAIILLGEKAISLWTAGKYNTYTVGEQRGCPLEGYFPSVPTIGSYFPQDCFDIVDHERRLNTQYGGSGLDDDSFDEGEEYEGTKRHGKTKRANWRFWLGKDLRKIAGKLQATSDDDKEAVPSYRIYPEASDVIEELRNPNEDTINLDIETDREFNITCFGFSLGLHRPIYVVPFLRYNYSNAYGTSFIEILKAIVLALNHKEIVIHNSMFDLFVLCNKYRMPFGRRIYDTMLAQHRCFPEVEKSLGHCVSLWTWQPYHKEEGVMNPQNIDQEMKLWQYNGKDVYTMMLVRRAIDLYASKHPGIPESIAQVNRCVRPYLLNTMYGIRYDETKIPEIISENDRLCNQYLRTMKLLTNTDLLPTSSKSCVKYFHDAMGYKVIRRSTKTGAPSLDEKSLYKLKIGNPQNVIIDLVFAFRRKIKETGILKFNPWKT
jgi:hypothetical protein